MKSKTRVKKSFAGCDCLREYKKKFIKQLTAFSLFTLDSVNNCQLDGFVWNFFFSILACSNFPSPPSIRCHMHAMLYKLKIIFCEKLIKLPQGQTMPIADANYEIYAILCSYVVVERWFSYRAIHASSIMVILEKFRKNTFHFTTEEIKIWTKFYVSEQLPTTSTCSLSFTKAVRCMKKKI